MYKQLLQNKKILIYVVIMAIILLFIFAFDLLPFKTSDLFSLSDIESLVMEKRTIILSDDISLMGSGLESLVSVDKKADIAEINEILSQYQFRRNLFQPSRTYRKDETSILYLSIGYGLERYFSIEITDSTYNNRLLISKREFSADREIYSIDLIGRNQQEKLYNELESFMLRHDLKDMSKSK